MSAKRQPFAPTFSPDQATFIDDLGGPVAVATELNRRLGTDFTSQAVSNWKRRGIPYRYRGPLVVMANRANVSAPADFFGIGTTAE